MSTTAVQATKLELPGTVNTFAGTVEGTTHESVTMQLRIQALATIVYPLRQVVQSAPVQVSHPVGQSTHVFELESYWKEIELQSE